MMTIEQAGNGWIIKSNYGTFVYTSIEEVLQAIYRGIALKWNVGDRIIIQREQDNPS